MSLGDQLEWYFHVSVWARETCGIARAAPPAAAASTNRRRLLCRGARARSFAMARRLLTIRRWCHGAAHIASMSRAALQESRKVLGAVRANHGRFAHGFSNMRPVKP